MSTTIETTIRRFKRAYLRELGARTTAGALYPQELPLSRGRILRSLYAPVLKTPEKTARLFAALALALILQGVAPPAALAQAEPGMGARSWVLADAESGEYLAGENASERLSMGSTDKIMVALVALRLVESGEAGPGGEGNLSQGAAPLAAPPLNKLGPFPGGTAGV